MSEGRYRETEADCKRTELAVEHPDDSDAPLRTMKLGAYPFTDNSFLRKKLFGEMLAGVGDGKGKGFFAG